MNWNKYKNIEKLMTRIFNTEEKLSIGLSWLYSIIYERDTPHSPQRLHIWSRSKDVGKSLFCEFVSKIHANAIWLTDRNLKNPILPLIAGHKLIVVDMSVDILENPILTTILNKRSNPLLTTDNRRPYFTHKTTVIEIEGRNPLLYDGEWDYDIGEQYSFLRDLAKWQCTKIETETEMH